MNVRDTRCAFCGAVGVEGTTITMGRRIDPVEVTVSGVPAAHCPTCGETGIHGDVAIPIDAAMLDILVAAGVASRPTPEEEAELRAENRALARSLGQEDMYPDDEVADAAGEPSGAGTAAR
ncbi:MAG: YgiT-type zinc finger protein [Chloroflexota bacterium]